MSTRAPRNGNCLGLEQPALAIALGERPVGAHDPLPGQGGSALAASTAPARRGAPGERSPYVVTRPRGIARTRARISWSLGIA